ncbi:hypothetical protein ACQJBY_015889 [Aegilops geniculata]
MSDTQTCACQIAIPCPSYKLPLTLTDASGSLDAIAFSRVAEDLVQHRADQVSMNMKIDATDHANALDNAIGKERLFYIGMNTDLAAKYPIKYVLKKTFSVDNNNSVPLLPPAKTAQQTNLLPPPTSSNIGAQSPIGQNTEASSENTPLIGNQTHTKIKENESRSGAKRRIDFTEDDATKSIRSEEHEHGPSKEYKKNKIDNKYPTTSDGQQE